MIMPSVVPQSRAAVAAVADSPAVISDGSRARSPDTPTIWGLTPLDLHDRFWASRAMQVVRPCGAEVAEHAPFYLLMEPGALALFDPAAAEEALANAAPGEAHLIYIRVHDTRERGPLERVVTDANNRFLRFERLYDRPRTHLARAAITRDATIARAWRASPSPRDGWPLLRRIVPKDHRSTLECDGLLYDGFLQSDLAAFVRDLTRFWERPDGTISRAIIGPVWIGAGRKIESSAMVFGPAILWDDPNSRPQPEPIRWLDIPWHGVTPGAATSPLRFQIEPALILSLAQARRLHNFFKRGFDIGFSIFALIVTLPLYPLIMLAIMLEDGFPIFFAHRRETLGGREFPCLKFRSMRRNAEKMKHAFAMLNQADGPQFFMDNDPRLTRVGGFLRKYRLDELPQFFNVLAGHMSVVGPRPSPFHENQYCPAWREARLSVRPGITGLWQIKRTRAPGTDFQEWIRYDIEYVENARWSLDLLIIWKTLGTIFRSRPVGSQESAPPRD